MRGVRFIPLVFACVLPPTAAAQEPEQTDRNPEMVTIDVEALRAEIQQILDEDSIPGASVALVERDRTVWAAGIGKADVAARVDVTADHLFRIGSISKSFTALAVLHAVEGGLLDLETPIRELAPDVEFTNPWKETHPITLATLMEHTTGFDGAHWLEMAVDDPEITLAQGLALHPHSRESRWRPGTLMSYNNSGPAMATFVLETITGGVFEDYVREHVFDPLGMASSTFHLPEGAALVAKGYEADGVSEAPYDHIFFRPSGALNSTAREMAQYLRMMINRGSLDGVRILAPDTITRMETPTTTLAAREGFTYGDGLGITTYTVNGHLFHGHGGTITGFRSKSGYSSDLGVGFFVSINKPSYRVEDIATLLVERLTEGSEKPQGAITTLSDDELRATTGTWQHVTPRSQIVHGLERLFRTQRITLEAGNLFIVPGGGAKRRLVPVTATGFRYDDEPVASVFKVVDAEGDPILQLARDGSFKKVARGWLLFQQGAAATTALLLISTVLFALVWVPAKLFGRMETLRLRAVVFPPLATLSIVVWFYLPAQYASTQALGNVSVWSLTWFLGSLVFAALTALSLLASFGSLSLEANWFFRWYGRLASLACTVALLYSWNNGWIGLRTWAY